MTKPEHVKCKAVNKLKSHAVTNVTVTVISVSQISTESFCNWNKINYGVGRSDLRSEQEVVYGRNAGEDITECGTLQTHSVDFSAFWERNSQKQERAERF